MRALVWVLLLLSTLSGCLFGRRHPSVECTEHSGEQWTLVETEHFLLQTPMGAPHAMAFAQAIELQSVAIGRVFDPPKFVANRKLDIVLLPTQHEMAHFDGAIPAGGFFAPRVPRLVVVAASPHITAHELSHFVVSNVYGGLPTWLGEGLAEYCGTSKVEDAHTVTIGDIDREALAWIHANGLVPLEQLWAWPPGSVREVHALYGSSWLWAHALLNLEEPRTFELLRRLAGTNDDRAAFNAVFPVETHPELERRVSRHGAAGSYRVRTLSDLPTPTLQVRPMTPAEVHVARSLVVRGEGADETRDEELRMAAELDPKSAQLGRMRALISAIDSRTKAWTAINARKCDEALVAVNAALEALPGDAELVGLRGVIERRCKTP